MTTSFRRSGVALALCVAGACAWWALRDDGATRLLFFCGEPAARITEERIDAHHVVLHAQLAPDGGSVDLDVALDHDGFVRSARSVRRGSWGERALEAHPAPGEHMVILELLERVRTAAAVTFVDLSSDERAPGRVELRGDDDSDVVARDARGEVIAATRAHRTERAGPGAFFEATRARGAPEPTGDVGACASLTPALDRATLPHQLRFPGLGPALATLDLDGPGQRVVSTVGGPTVVFDRATVARAAPSADDHAATSVLERDDPRVIAFARAHGDGVSPELDARSIVTAVARLIDARATDVPPSATLMLAHGGDCDGAAALVAASLRALGHAARPVVGLKLHQGKLVPHAWAEVYTPDGWTMADATLPDLGVFPTHLKLAEGLGSTLTIGRILGRFTPIVVEE